MPIRIDLTIFWSPECDQSSFYSLYRHEIEEMIMNYELEEEQADLFTYVDVEVIRQWMWDVFCREPEEVIVDSIKY